MYSLPEQDALRCFFCYNYNIEYLSSHPKIEAGICWTSSHIIGSNQTTVTDCRERRWSDFAMLPSIPCINAFNQTSRHQLASEKWIVIRTNPPQDIFFKRLGFCLSDMITPNCMADIPITLLFVWQQTSLIYTDHVLIHSNCCKSLSYSQNLHLHCCSN